MLDAKEIEEKLDLVRERLIPSLKKEIQGREENWLKELRAKKPIFSLLKAETLFFDRLIQKILTEFRLILRKEEELAFLATGSYGREEVCPYSDLDLLIVHPPKLNLLEAKIAEKLLLILWDLGLKVGYSLRTVKQSISLAKKDHTVFGALLDIRMVYGKKHLLDELIREREESLIPKFYKNFLNKKLKEYDTRRKKYGSYVGVVEPELMEGPGGLRDYHFLLWNSKLRYLSQSLDGLVRAGLLSRTELSELRKGVATIFKIRVGLHLVSKRKNDRLLLELQTDLAQLLGIRPRGFRSREEGLLEEFYPSAEAVERITKLFVERVRRELKPATKLLKKKIIDPELGLIKLGKELDFEKSSIKETLRTKPEKILYCFSVLEKTTRLSQNALALIRSVVRDLDPKMREKEELALYFKKILSSPFCFVPLFQMYETNFLFWYLPEYSRIRYLAPRDNYHRYTVDLHNLLVIKELNRLFREDYKNEEPELTELVREKVDWLSLNLSALLHDIGKGNKESHEKISGALAKRVFGRLRLDSERKELIRFLIENHLLLNHYAQRRDIFDPHTIARLAIRIAYPERLRLLYILTFSDIKAVSETSWTGWKSSLLRELYSLTSRAMERGGFLTRALEESYMTKSAELKDRLKADPGFESIKPYLKEIPARYIVSFPVSEIVKDLKLVACLTREKLILVDSKPLESSYLRIAIATYDYPGLFSDLSGVLSSLNFDILNAEILTFSDGKILDLFQVQDLVYARTQDPLELEQRLERLFKTFRKVIAKELRVEKLVQSQRGLFKIPKKLKVTTKVEADEELSKDFTIVEVQAQNRLGLLYQITRALFETGMDIHIAKISTRGEQVLDVFYIRKNYGGKPTGKELDPTIQKLKEIVEVKEE